MARKYDPDILEYQLKNYLIAYDSWLKHCCGFQVLNAANLWASEQAVRRLNPSLYYSFEEHFIEAYRRALNVYYTYNNAGKLEQRSKFGGNILASVIPDQQSPQKCLQRLGFKQITEVISERTGKKIYLYLFTKDDYEKKCKELNINKAE